MSPYHAGWVLGVACREDRSLDPRWEFADASRAGHYAEFRDGFYAGLAGLPREESR